MSVFITWAHQTNRHTYIYLFQNGPTRQLIASPKIEERYWLSWHGSAARWLGGPTAQVFTSTEAEVPRR